MGCVTNDQLKHSEHYRREASLVLIQRPEDGTLGRNFSPAFQIGQPSAGCWERRQSACSTVRTEERQLKINCKLGEFLPGVLVRQKNVRENSTCFCGLASSLSLIRAGAALYRRLKEYLMTEEQLKENGYPMPHPEKPGRAVLFTAEEKKSTDCKLGCFILQSLLSVSQVEGDACPTCSMSFCIEMFCSQHGAAFACVAMCCSAVQPVQVLGFFT